MSVPGPVRQDLLVPIPGVLLRLGRVLRAAVPEAGVDVDGKAGAGEYEVGLAPNSRARPQMYTEPEPMPVCGAAGLHLGLSPKSA